MKKVTLTPELLNDNNLNITQTVILATIHTYMNDDVLLMTNQDISNILNNKLKVNTVKKVIYQLRNLGYISTKRYIQKEPEYDQFGTARVIRLVTEEEAQEPVSDEQQKIFDFITNLKSEYVQSEKFNDMIEACNDFHNNPDVSIDYKEYTKLFNKHKYRLTKL